MSSKVVIVVIAAEATLELDLIRDLQRTDYSIVTYTSIENKQFTNIPYIVIIDAKSLGMEPYTIRQHFNPPHRTHNIPLLFIIDANQEGEYGFITELTPYWEGHIWRGSEIEELKIRIKNLIVENFKKD